MARSAIVGHPRNPRVIDKHSRKKLRESIGRDGLVTTLTLNRRTGHLLGGHQRLALLDAEAEGAEYSLDVAVVDVDEVREREILVRLNNHALEGSYDFGALEALLKDVSVPIDPAALGFDSMDLEIMFPDMPSLVSEPFKKGQDAAEPDIDAIKAAKKKGKEEGKAKDNSEFYVCFVGRDPSDVVRLLDLLQLDPEQRFHDIDVLFSHLAKE